jgi:hypothetical protein
MLQRMRLAKLRISQPNQRHNTETKREMFSSRSIAAATLLDLRLRHACAAQSAWAIVLDSRQFEVRQSLSLNVVGAPIERKQTGSDGIRVFTVRRRFRAKSGLDPARIRCTSNKTITNRTDDCRGLLTFDFSVLEGKEAS